MKLRSGLRAGMGSLTVAAAAMLCVQTAPGEKKAAPAPPPEPKPAVSIDVKALGYEPPGTFYMTYRLSSAALGFFDDDHLLFTFRVGGLLKRVPGDPEDDDDQQIRAVVLDLGTGNVVKKTEWRMHDRLQYLWPFEDGNFLVRQRDSLFLTGQSLALEPYMTFSTGLEHIQISPDRKLMVVETDEPEKVRAQAAEPRSLGLGEPVKVIVLPVGSKIPIAESDGTAPIMLPLMGDGLLDMLEGKAPGYWAMRDLPFHGEARLVTEVKSGCRPSVKPLSATVVLVEGCYLDGNDHAIEAVSMDGRELWRDRWQNRYVWPWFDMARNGTRFAYESIAVNRPVSSFDAIYPEDVVAQMVGVYDTQSGKLLLVRDASPVLTAGQNVALSADGTRFAVLRNGAIEVYDLPPADEEQATGKATGSR